MCFELLIISYLFCFVFTLLFLFYFILFGPRAHYLFQLNRTAQLGLFVGPMAAHYNFFCSPNSRPWKEGQAQNEALGRPVIRAQCQASACLASKPTRWLAFPSRTTCPCKCPNVAFLPWPYARPGMQRPVPFLPSPHAWPCPLQLIASKFAQLPVASAWPRAATRPRSPSTALATSLAAPYPLHPNPTRPCHAQGTPQLCLVVCSPLHSSDQ